MDDIVLVNDSGTEINDIDELMLYVLDNYGSGAGLTGDTESDFYSFLIENEIIEDIDFKLESLKDGYRILRQLEPNYWHKETI